MSTASFAAVFALLGMALAITTAGALSTSATMVFPKGWTDLYQAPYQNNPTIMMSLACIEDNLCYAPGATNGQGVNIFQFDGSINAPWNPMQLEVTGMEIMILAIGAGGTSAAPHGVAGGPDIFGGLLFLANTTTWASPLALPFTATTSVAVDKATGLRQAFPDELATTNVIWVSTDGGYTFGSKNVSGAPLPTPNCTYVRYIANPTPDVIYLTLGNFPGNKDSRGSDSDIARRVRRSPSEPFSFKRNEHSEVAFDGKGGVRHIRTARAERNANGPFGSSSSSSSSGFANNCGYSAAILKSTDGGNTWSTILESTGLWYPNEIACSNATHCVFVAEGAETGALVYRTTDGQNFEVTLHVANNATVSHFLQTAAISPANSNIVLVGGGRQTQTGTDEGLFYGSEDGGATWTEHQKVEFIVEAMQISFGRDGTAFAVAESEFQAATILRYNPNGPVMTPAPAYIGNFTQKVCNQSSPCTEGCVSTSLPQNVCLQMEGGGSLMSRCDMQGQVLVQNAYILSTACEGPAEEQVAPLATCLNGNGNSLEFYCGNSGTSEVVTSDKLAGIRAKGIRKA
jgi:hypothetical protein